MSDIVKKEFKLLQLTANRVLTVGKSIEVETISFKQALAYEGSLDLSPQDSIIYAAVVADIRRRPLEEKKCFVSRNWRDFDDPAIKSELALYNCQYVRSFEEGLRFIQRFA